VPREPGHEAGLLRIYGRRPVLAALRAGVVRQLQLADNVRGEIIRDARRLADEQGIFVEPLDISRLPKDTLETHQGVMAKVIAPAPRRDLEVLVDDVLQSGELASFLLLDSIEDPQNFGAILRTSACAGVHAVLVAARRRAPLSATVVKASAGAVFSVPIVEVSNLHQAARYLKTQGIWLVAAAGEAEMSYTDFDWRRHTALLMGAEGRGVSHLLRQIADEQVRIPLLGDIESLNVSVATGVLLFESLRQREG
jgi:23S rRNA (guanosine2251-2'-O)-methyltransferase